MHLNIFIHQYIYFWLGRELNLLTIRNEAVFWNNNNNNNVMES